MSFTNNPKLFLTLLNIFFMKKLLLTMGCITAVILMSSCTADSVEDIKNENSTNSNQIPISETTDISPVETDILPGEDDKDKAKT